jgi:hypothetical protein
MMTSQLEVSIIAAPLGAIDRRALSQAWYSALRFTRVPPPAASAKNANAAKSLPYRSALSTAPRELRSQQFGLPRPVLISQRHTLSGGDSWSAAIRYREARTMLAERIERAFADPNAHPKRATFSMGRGTARVVVILQTKQRGMMLLAICRPEVRCTVARALTQARRALAARGIGIEPAGGCKCS